MTIKRTWIGALTSIRASERGRMIAAADSMRDRGEPAAAAEYYRRAIAVGERSAGIRKQLANALKDSGKYEEALKEYRTCLRDEPDDADTYLQMGHLFKVWGDLTKAGEHYERACNCGEPSADAVAELNLMRQNGTFRAAEPVGRPESQGAGLPTAQRAPHIEETVRSLGERVDALSQRLEAYAGHPGHSVADQVSMAEARNRLDALLPMFLNMNSAIARLAAEVERLSRVVDGAQDAPVGDVCPPVKLDAAAPLRVRKDSRPPDSGRETGTAIQTRGRMNNEPFAR